MSPVVSRAPYSPMSLQVTEGSSTTRSGRTEVSQTGLVAWRDVRSYLRHFGSKVSGSAVIISVFLAAATCVASNCWLTFWTDSSVNHRTLGWCSESQGCYLAVYASLGGLDVAASLLQGILLLFGSLRASRKCHESVIQRIVRAPMKWFNDNPSGRIFNRMHQDMQNVDVFVPDAVQTQLTETMLILVQVIVLFVDYIWHVLLLIIPIIMCYCGVLIWVLSPTMQARRLSMVAHSPVYSHFTDSLAGLETIRAFGAEQRFQRRHGELVEQMARAVFAQEAFRRWGRTSCAMIGVALYLVCVVTVVFSSEAPIAGRMGLVLVFAAQVQHLLMDYAINLTTLEADFVSVERVMEYANVPIEEDQAGHPRAPTSTTSLPRACEVQMRNVWLCYGSAPVLHGLSLTIPAYSKTAVCGRTGGGKTSLLAVLSRLFECEGTVLVGGVNIKEMKLQHLRALVRVVPQESICVRGTLRENLAGPSPPEGTDGILRFILAAVGLQPALDRITLDGKVAEQGGNLSTGEKQLLSLARALVPVDVTGWARAKARYNPGTGCFGARGLTTPQVVLCDEAAGDVDAQTQLMVCEILLETCVDSTVVAICHNLKFLRRFDNAVVVARGQVVEEGPPGDLLADESTQLSGLCRAAGVDLAPPAEVSESVSSGVSSN